MAIDIMRAQREARKAAVGIPEQSAQEPVSATPVKEPAAPVDATELPEDFQARNPQPSVETPEEQPVTSRPKKAVTKQSETTTIPGFPNNLMKMIRRDIPSATNNCDALAAWIWVKSGKHEEVSEKIRILADDFQMTASDDMLGTILEKVTRIERSSMISASATADEYYILLWLMLERMAMINSPRMDTIDFTDQAFDQLRTTLQQRIQQAKNVRQLREGRPYR